MVDLKAGEDGYRSGMAILRLSPRDVFSVTCFFNHERKNRKDLKGAKVLLLRSCKQETLVSDWKCLWLYFD